MTIQEVLYNILHAVFGKDVRQSIHDGVKRANDICEETEARQTKLETKYDLLLKNCTELSPSDVEIVDARVNGNGIIYGTLGERLNALDDYSAEIESSRDTKDKTSYNTLGERLDALDDEMDKKMDSNTASKEFNELNKVLEKYLPRIGEVTFKMSLPAMGTGTPSTAFSSYCIEDELITENAKILAIYRKVETATSEDTSSALADAMVDVSAIIAYTNVDKGCIYLKEDDSDILLGCYAIYVRDILKKDSLET